MAAFSFNLAFYAFSEWNAAANTNDTVYYSGTPTIALDADAQLTVIQVNDDDGSNPNEFSDGYIDTPGDGSSPSTANNDQLLDQAITLNGTTFAADSTVELEFAFQTDSGDTFWIIRIDGQNVGIGGPTLPTPGSTYTVLPQPADDELHDGQSIPIEDVPCFTRNSLLLTPSGWVPISELRLGDKVQTADNGFQEIRWIGAKAISGRELTENLQPILIPKDAFGDGVPFRDLVVSPQHRVMMKGPGCQLYFAEHEVFAAAKHLRSGRRLNVDRVEYWHLMFDEHQAVMSNGMETESFFPGDCGLNALDAAARQEILTLFPELGTDMSAYGETSRPCITARESMVLQARA